MFFDTAFVTTMNAQQVANAIQAFLDGMITDQFFKLEVEKTDGGQHHELWVRPMVDVEAFGLANGMDVVKCLSIDGTEVDIIVPHHHREVCFALVLTPSPSAA